MKTFSITVTRDSVCAADDMFAPHVKRFRFQSDCKIADVIFHLQKQYVPLKIQGGKATWLVQTDRLVAAIVARWEHPVFFIDPNTRITNGIELKNHSRIRLLYFGSVNPLSFLHDLMLGQPVPLGIMTHQVEKLKSLR